jgi:hypothetical protein
MWSNVDINVKLIPIISHFFKLCDLKQNELKVFMVLQAAIEKSADQTTQLRIHGLRRSLIGVHFPCRLT